LDQLRPSPCCVFVGFHPRPCFCPFVAGNRVGGISARLPSGRQASTNRTPRRRILPMTASAQPSNGWRSRVIITETGTSRRWVVCRPFLITRAAGCGCTLETVVVAWHHIWKPHRGRSRQREGDRKFVDSPFRRNPKVPRRKIKAQKPWTISHGTGRSNALPSKRLPGYRWIKSHAWMPDFDTCEPLA
jgi:hypothetical protein